MSLSLSHIHNKIILQHAVQRRLVNKPVDVRTLSGLQMVVYVFLDYSLHGKKRLPATPTLRLCEVCVFYSDKVWLSGCSSYQSTCVTSQKSTSHSHRGGDLISRLFFVLFWHHVRNVVCHFNQ